MPNEYPLQHEAENIQRVQPAKILKSFGLQHVRALKYGILPPGGLGDRSNNEYDIPSGTTVFDNADTGADGKTLMSYLGTPVFSNLDFVGGSYKNLQGEQITYDDLRIDTVLFDVSQSRNIVTTEIQGRNGTIKEYISDGDFAININGIIVSPDGNEYPEKDVQTLVEILQAQTTIGIASRFLNDVFNVTDVVVMSYKFPQPEGFQNMQPFSIQCLSNDPVELQIKTR